MNKDTAREVLECIRNYIQFREETGGYTILMEREKERERLIIKQFADLISFNT